MAGRYTKRPHSGWSPLDTSGTAASSQPLESGAGAGQTRFGNRRSLQTREGYTNYPWGVNTGTNNSGTGTPPNVWTGDEATRQRMLAEAGTSSPSSYSRLRSQLAEVTVEPAFPTTDLPTVTSAGTPDGLVPVERTDSSVTWSNITQDTPQKDDATRPPLDARDASDVSAKPVTIGRMMPAAEIIGHLGDHGCEDVTALLDMSTSSQWPISSGGFGDVYKVQLHDSTEVAVKTTRLHVDLTSEGEKQLKVSFPFRRHVGHWLDMRSMRPESCIPGANAVIRTYSS
ncbi:hypothetical protein FRC09_001674 [Ceratobasidium sp. 395]|nr:hypothetical protein FRC09_001674 [Ceratobasidium sp. 395]